MWLCLFSSRPSAEAHEQWTLNNADVEGVAEVTIDSGSSLRSNFGRTNICKECHVLWALEALEGDISLDVKLNLHQMSRSPSSGCHSARILHSIPLLRPVLIIRPDKHLCWRRQRSVFCTLRWAVFTFYIHLCSIIPDREQDHIHST